MFIAVADSPCYNDGLRSKLEGTFDTPADVSRQSEEMSAADELQSGLSRVSLRPLTAASPSSSSYPVKTTSSGPASSDSLMVHAAVSSCSSIPVLSTEPSHKVAQQQVVKSESAETALNTSLLRNEATRVLQSVSGLDRSSISTDRRSSSSPEIDILPVVRRARAAADSDSGGGAGFGDPKSLQCGRSNVDSRYDASTVESRVTQPSVHRCGSPSLGDDGECSRRKPTHVPAAITPSQSTMVGGVRLIPLSQVMSTSPSAGSASRHGSAKICHVADVSTEAAGNKSVKSRGLSRSSVALEEQTQSVKLPKAGRRRSSRLRVPKGILGRGKQCPADEEKAVKFDVSFRKAEPTDKENVCVQRATEQQAVPFPQPPQQDSRVHSDPSVKSRTSSGNSSLCDDESDAGSAEIRRSFIKRARLDVKHADLQRLPTSWERHANKCPVASRRMSDRIKQKEGDVVSTQQNESEKTSPLVTGRKRWASSSSSGLSSGEKKPAKKITRTIAMTSLHSRWVLCNSHVR